MGSDEVCLQQQRGNVQFPADLASDVANVGAAVAASTTRAAAKRAATAEQRRRCGARPKRPPPLLGHSTFSDSRALRFPPS